MKNKIRRIYTHFETINIVFFCAKITRMLIFGFSET